MCYLPSFLQVVSSFITISHFMWNGDDMVSYNNRIHPDIKSSDIYNPTQMLIICTSLIPRLIYICINIQHQYPNLVIPNIRVAKNKKKKLYALMHIWKYLYNMAWHKLHAFPHSVKPFSINTRLGKTRALIVCVTYYRFSNPPCLPKRCLPSRWWSDPCLLAISSFPRTREN